MTPQSQARTRRTSGQQGFTLVELIMATMVFAIGMVAVLGSMVAVVNHSRISTTKHQATLQMISQFEALRADLPTNEDLLTFDVNVPTPIELEGLPGSEILLYVVRPDDPDTGIDETEIYELPIQDQTVIDGFGDFPPVIEVMMEARIPTNTNPDNTTRYVFRLTALY